MEEIHTTSRMSLAELRDATEVKGLVAKTDHDDR